jgi:hypothetical protein
MNFDEYLAWVMTYCDTILLDGGSTIDEDIVGI